MRAKQALRAFYTSRAGRLQESGLDLSLVDLTGVFDPFLDEKIERPVMIVGEAPGAKEVARGEPFCGAGGKNLDLVLELNGLNRQRDFLITNAFAFRTFEKTARGVKNRTPSLAELKFGADLLLEEIAIVRPRLILALGGSSQRALGLIYAGIKAMKNHSICDVNLEQIGFKTRLGISFHPSPLVYNTRAKREKLHEFFARVALELADLRAF
ncbi:MAG: uracil-DNA glycosylase family protein [Helicobacteraceae bacterium]